MTDQPIPGDKPRYTYTAQLLSKMTPRASGIRRRASNWTTCGTEAVVSFPSSEDEQPQLYKVVITPLDHYDDVAAPDGADGVDDYIRLLRHPLQSESDRLQRAEEVAMWNAR